MKRKREEKLNRAGKLFVAGLIGELMLSGVERPTEDLVIALGDQKFPGWMDVYFLPEREFSRYLEKSEEFQKFMRGLDFDTP